MTETFTEKDAQDRLTAAEACLSSLRKDRSELNDRIRAGVANRDTAARLLKAFHPTKRPRKPKQAPLEGVE